MHKLFIFGLFLLCQSTSADVTLLVHGYLGGANSWQESSINPILTMHSWKYQGTLSSAQPGIVLGTHKATNPLPKKSLYTVQLPFKAPLDTQAGMLQNIINAITYKHADEPITIVGHSSGGLVARVTLVRYGKGQVDRLITIASPHLGTPRAAQALDAADSSGPFGFVKRFFGGSDYQLVKSSKRLLRELMPPRPNNYLYGLNQMAHPDIQYVSIVRATPAGRVGDRLVPGYSQNMNNILALANRSFVYYMPSTHKLVPNDGILLANMLNLNSSVDRYN